MVDDQNPSETDIGWGPFETLADSLLREKSHGALGPQGCEESGP
jgi:hypothetical protein